MNVVNLNHLRPSVIACSHRRHGQDKTVLSCLDPVSSFQVFLNIFETEQLEIGNWVETRQTCLVLSAVVFTTPTQTRQDKTVLSRLCQRYEQAITVSDQTHVTVICCRDAVFVSTSMTLWVTTCAW